MPNSPFPTLEEALAIAGMPTGNLAGLLGQAFRFTFTRENDDEVNPRERDQQDMVGRIEGYNLDESIHELVFTVSNRYLEDSVIIGLSFSLKLNRWALVCDGLDMEDLAGTFVLL